MRRLRNATPIALSLFLLLTACGPAGGPGAGPSSPTTADDGSNTGSTLPPATTAPTASAPPQGGSNADPGTLRYDIAGDEDRSGNAEFLEDETEDYGTGFRLFFEGDNATLVLVYDREYDGFSLSYLSHDQTLSIHAYEDNCSTSFDNQRTPENGGSFQCTDIMAVHGPDLTPGWTIKGGWKLKN